jgi:GWxTD domain-containing protein
VFKDNSIIALKALLIGLIIANQQLMLSAQPLAYFSFSTFNTPKNQPFLETHLTIVGSSLHLKRTTLPYQNSVNILFTIHKNDTILVKANKYNLISPYFYDTLNIPTFIDNQRYPLPNGIYQIELVISDNHSETSRVLKFKDEVKVDYSSDSLQCSSIQLLESFKKTETQNALTKSGYDLIPYTVNYFPETTNDLIFYVESYNANNLLGESKPFVYSYYLEMADKGTKLNSFGAFKKQQSAAVNPLLAKLDISKLGSGNYHLVIDLIDENNQLRLKKKIYFQRLNRRMEISQLQAIDDNQNLVQYFGRCDNSDTLRMFVESLWPIAGTSDKERIINQSLKKDNDLMKNFIVDFWQRRAADTANPLKMWGMYYKSVQQALALFKCGKQKGYYTDRGRVYLQYGPPSQRSQQTNEANTFPYEIWQYYQITDAVNGQHYSNRKFVFVNKMLGDDCYNLIHSDMRGENNNPRWQFEVTRRNSNGSADLENTVPSGTENNQFKDIFSNPR